jgi:cytoskeleton protein RodZ
MVDTEANEAALFPERVGDRLRAARIKAGMDLSDIATRTRIPQRHLAAIEAGDYAALPAPTYCTGFVKAYARAVGADEVALGHDLRVELGRESGHNRMDHADYDAADPTRLPTRVFAWTAAAIALLIAAAYLAWSGGYLGGSPSTPTEEAPMAAAPDPSAVPPPVAGPVAAPTSGDVVLTARETVWFRIYDANDKVLFAGEKKAGESFAVPADANNPQIRTGRPNAIKVTIAGTEVAPLGPPETLIKNVGVSASALSARAPLAPNAGAPTGSTGQIGLPPTGTGSSTPATQP